MRILLIAGHGQGDPGAVGNGHKEAECTRHFTELLAKHLGWGLDVEVYDTKQDLIQTRNYASLMSYDQIIEIHFNAASNPEAKGCEVLISQDRKANNVDNACLGALGKYFTNRGIKLRDKEGLGNMRQFQAMGIDYRLLELCFISNANDMKVYFENAENIAKDITLALRPLFGFNSEPTSAPEAPTPSPTPTQGGAYAKHYAENGVATFTESCYINVEPKYGANTDTLYNPGESVNYDEVIYNDGYIWVGYTRNNGTRGYIATGKYDSNIKRTESYATFK